MSRLSEAWKTLMGKKAATLYQSQYQIINGQYIGINDNKSSYITNGYLVNDVLYSIINLVLDKVRLPEWGVYKIIDEGSLKSYEGLMRRKNLSASDYRKAQEFKTKALQLIEVQGLSELLKYPNKYETMQDLAANSTGYKMLTGDRYIWSERLKAGANEGKPFALHILPSPEVTIIANREVFPIQEVGYNIASVGMSNIPKADVLHDKYWNPEWSSNGNHLYGLSPIKSALKTLTRNNSAKKSSAAMFQNQGVKGVLYMDDPRVLNTAGTEEFSVKQMQALKEKFTVGEWTGEDQHGRIGTSGYKVGWQSVGLSPVDLNVIESEKWDAIMMCAIFGVPPELLGLTAKTYNNMKEAETSLTSRCAMPQLVSLRDSFNRKLSDDWGYKDKNLFVDFDQTVFTELQEDVKEKSVWVNQLKGLAPNEQRNLLGLERIEDPLFDEPWITPDMGSPLSEWSIDGTDTQAGDGSVPGK